MKERFYHIDSRHKVGTGDVTNPMTWRFPDTLRGIQTMQVIEAVIPNTMHTVPADNNLSFTLTPYNSTFQHKFDIVVPAGAYSYDLLANKLNIEIAANIALRNGIAALTGNPTIIASQEIYVDIDSATGFVSIISLTANTSSDVAGKPEFVAENCSSFYNVLSPISEVYLGYVTGTLEGGYVTRSTKVIDLSQPTAFFLAADELHDAEGTIEVSPEAPLGNRKGIVARLQHPGERFELTHHYNRDNRPSPVIRFTRPDVALSKLTLTWVDSDGKTIDYHGSHWSAYVRVVANF